MEQLSYIILVFYEVSHNNFNCITNELKNRATARFYSFVETRKLEGVFQKDYFAPVLKSVTDGNCDYNRHTPMVYTYKTKIKAGRLIFLVKSPQLDAYVYKWQTGTERTPVCLKSINIDDCYKTQVIQDITRYYNILKISLQPIYNYHIVL